MIEIKQIIAPTVELFDPEGNSLGILNEYEFTEIRAQIKEQQLKGYSFKCEEGTFQIDWNGRLEYYPKCFDLLSDAYLRLI